MEKGKAKAKSEEKKDEEEPGEPGNIDKKVSRHFPNEILIYL